jgi:hypothetical protein
MTLRRVRPIGFVLALALADLARTKAQEVQTLALDPLTSQDVVVWYYGGLHHLIRDEDSDMTHLMWVGFMLRPFSVWPNTPLYP